MSSLFQEGCKQDQKLEEPSSSLRPAERTPHQASSLQGAPKATPPAPRGSPLWLCGLGTTPTTTSLASSVTQAWASSGGVSLPFSALSTTQGLHLCSTSIKQKHEKFQPISESTGRHLNFRTQGNTIRLPCFPCGKTDCFFKGPRLSGRGGRPMWEVPGPPPPRHTCFIPHSLLTQPPGPPWLTFLQSFITVNNKPPCCVCAS